MAQCFSLPRQCTEQVVESVGGMKTVLWTKPRYKTSESENHWLIKELDNGIEIQFGKEKLTELQNAIKGIPKGKGDFAISDQNEENILYFWGI